MTPRSRAPAFAVGALGLVVVVGCADTSAGKREVPVVSPDERCSSFLAPKVVATLGSSEIKEASGLVVSRTNDGVLWTHNDSGDVARLFAVRTDGSLVGAVAIAGATAVDWEDLAIAPGQGGDDLYIGDIGDNDRVRPSIVVYRVHEPTLFPAPPASLDVAARIELGYGDGRARNAESLVVDPVRGDIVIVTKEESGASEIFVASGPFPSSARATLRRAGDLAFGSGPLSGGKRATGGSISRDGSLVVLRTYESAFAWRRAKEVSVAEALLGAPCAIPLAEEAQGEAIALLPNGAGYYTTTEGKKPPLSFVGPR